MQVFAAEHRNLAAVLSVMIVVMSEDGERYLHVHAVDGQGSGPEALFETEFPESGIYKIWGQFQKDGEVFTVSYVVKVS